MAAAVETEACEAHRHGAEASRLVRVRGPGVERDTRRDALLGAAQVALAGGRLQERSDEKEPER